MRKFFSIVLVFVLLMAAAVAEPFELPGGLTVNVPGGYEYSYEEDIDTHIWRSENDRLSIAASELNEIEIEGMDSDQILRTVAATFGKTTEFEKLDLPAGDDNLAFCVLDSEIPMPTVMILKGNYIYGILYINIDIDESYNIFVNDVIYRWLSDGLEGSDLQA